MGQDIPLEVDQAAGGGVLDQADQGLALQDVNVQVQILDAGAVIVQQQLGDPAVAVDGQGVVVILAALGDLGLLVGDGDVGAAGLVGLQQSIEVEVDGDVGVAHDHIALLLVLQEAQDGGQRLDAAGVDPDALLSEGRHDVQAAVTAGHIPLAAGAQMVHQEW